MTNPKADVSAPGGMPTDMPHTSIVIVEKASPEDWKDIDD